MNSSVDGDARKWGIVAMLFGVQVVNWADKSVVGLAGTAIMQELHLSSQQYGFVASSFYSLYALTGILVGLLIAPRVRPRVILIGLLFVWSLSQLPIVFVSSLGTLIACRVVLGMGEGSGTPTAINACHEWFASDRRSLPTALVMLGTSVGSVAAAPTLSIIIDSFGWRMAFLACSAAGGAMLLLWLLFGIDGPYDGTKRGAITGTSRGPATLDTVTQVDLWSDRSIYGSFVLGFCSYWLLGFMVAWLAPYGALVLGYDRVTIGWILFVVYLAHAALILGSGIVSQTMMAQGFSSRKARAVLNGLCMLASAICFAAVIVIDGRLWRMVLLGLAVGFPNVTFTLNPPLLSDIVPASHRNRLMNLMLSGITIAAIAAPVVAGWLIGSRGVIGWNYAFHLNIALALVAAGSCFFLIHPQRSCDRLDYLAEQRSARNARVP